MFKLIIQIITLIYLIMVIYNIINLQKYNINGFIIKTNELSTLKNNIIKLNPILFYNNINLKINSKLSILSDFINYKNDLPNYMYKNNTILSYFDSDIFFNYQSLNHSNFLFPISKSISIISGKNDIPLERCIHNYNIIGILDGSTTVYLFNPKHKEEIVNKEINQIKKWAHKKILDKGNILFIPPYWSVFQEINHKVIQYHMKIDTFLTFIPNYFKEL